MAIVQGENYLASEQWELALNGDSVDYLGFETIIDKYKYTKTGNVARAYAGICCYQMSDFDQAKNHLKKFKAGDRMISPAITGLIGDCYVDMNETAKGIDYFEKAAKKADNDLLSPVFLKKAGIAYESLNEYKKAIQAYTTIKEKYPNSNEANDIDKYIYRAQLK